MFCVAHFLILFYTSEFPLSRKESTFNNFCMSNTPKTANIRYLTMFIVSDFHFNQKSVVKNKQQTDLNESKVIIFQLSRHQNEQQSLYKTLQSV